MFLLFGDHWPLQSTLWYASKTQLLSKPTQIQQMDENSYNTQHMFN